MPGLRIAPQHAGNTRVMRDAGDVSRAMDMQSNWLAREPGMPSFLICMSFFHSNQLRISGYRRHQTRCNQCDGAGTICRPGRGEVVALGREAAEELGLLGSESIAAEDIANWVDRRQLLLWARARAAQYACQIRSYYKSVRVVTFVASRQSQHTSHTCSKQPQRVHDA